MFDDSYDTSDTFADDDEDDPPPEDPAPEDPAPKDSSTSDDQPEYTKPELDGLDRSPQDFKALLDNAKAVNDPAVVLLENPQSVTFMDAYRKFRDAQHNWSEIDTWRGIADGMLADVTTFQTDLVRLEDEGGWKGETHDAAIANVNESLIEPQTAAKGAAALGVLSQYFADTLFYSKKDLMAHFDALIPTLLGFPSHADETLQAFDAHAQWWFRDYYMPSINRIADRNPGFTPQTNPDTEDPPVDPPTEDPPVDPPVSEENPSDPPPDVDVPPVDSPTYTEDSPPPDTTGTVETPDGDTPAVDVPEFEPPPSSSVPSDPPPDVDRPPVSPPAVDVPEFEPPPSSSVPSDPPPDVDRPPVSPPAVDVGFEPPPSSSVPSDPPPDVDRPPVSPPAVDVPEFELPPESEQPPNEASDETEAPPSQDNPQNVDGNTEQPRPLPAVTPVPNLSSRPPDKSSGPSEDSEGKHDWPSLPDTPVEDPEALAEDLLGDPTVAEVFDVLRNDPEAAEAVQTLLNHPEVFDAAQDLINDEQPSAQDPEDQQVSEDSPAIEPDISDEVADRRVNTALSPSNPAAGLSSDSTQAVSGLIGSIFDGVKQIIDTAQGTGADGPPLPPGSPLSPPLESAALSSAGDSPAGTSPSGGGAGGGPTGGAPPKPDLPLPGSPVVSAAGSVAALDGPQQANSVGAPGQSGAGAGGGVPPGGGGGGGQRPDGQDHKPAKVLRGQKNGDNIIGESDAVMAVIGDDGPRGDSSRLESFGLDL